MKLPDTKNNNSNNPLSETKKRSSEEVVIDLLSAKQDSTSNNQQKWNRPPESPAKYNRHSIEEIIIPDPQSSISVQSFHENDSTYANSNLLFFDTAKKNPIKKKPHDPPKNYERWLSFFHRVKASADNSEISKL